MKNKRKQYESKRNAKNVSPKSFTKKNIRKKNTNHTVIRKKKRSKIKPGTHTRNANSRRIFKSQELTCQFLKDYCGFSVFDDLKPTDIEDVTGKYQAYLGIEFETDTVKKVRVRIGEEQQEIYVIPLIEHKSKVDYDVQIQILRYMAVIWHDYGKKKNKKARMKVTAQKRFRYPLILPIVYYEGKENWTADMQLYKRIELGEEMKAYIPDFTYKVVRIGQYTNDELKQHKNEMSLVMLMNKIQSAENYTEFIKTSKEYMTEVLKDTPSDLMEILMDVFWALLMKMNVPQEEAKDLMEHMGAKDMGYLFENAEKMDIQAERRNTQEAQKKLSESERKLDESEQKLNQMEQWLKMTIEKLIVIYKQEGLNKEQTRNQLVKRDKMIEEMLDLYFEEIWNEK